MSARTILKHVYENGGMTKYQFDRIDRVLKERERPHGEWEALGFQQGYAFCRCSNCHKTMRLYRDSKNEFCCIADIRKKVVSCMYCGADMSANDRQVTGKLKEEPKDSHAEYWNSIGEWKEGEAE